MREIQRKEVEKNKKKKRVSQEGEKERWIIDEVQRKVDKKKELKKDEQDDGADSNSTGNLIEMMSQTCASC